MKKRERGAEEEAGGVGVCEGAEEIKYNLYVMCDCYLKKNSDQFYSKNKSTNTQQQSAPRIFFPI